MYTQTTQVRRIANHECLMCGKPLGEEKHVRCSDCRAVMREYGMGRYYRLEAAHKCTRCSAQMPENWYYTYCEKCRNKDNARKHKWNG